MVWRERNLLEMRGISKSFPGVKALDKVDFDLQAGQIHALLGENGAGKSTLIKVLTGVYRYQQGKILLNGNVICPHSPQEAQHLGISTVYQEVNLIPALSVAENIFLGREHIKWGRIDWRTIQQRARQALAKLDLELDVKRPLNTYSVAIQQLVAVARALDIRCKVLVLDEPTSSLDAAEVENLFSVMRKLKQEGLGIIFISHFIDQVYAISDRFTILRNGHRVGEYDPKDLPRLELIGKMIGKEADQISEAPEFKPGEKEQKPSAPFLKAHEIQRKGSVGPLDIEVFAGEVVGIAGLLGSGRTETARLLFGIDPIDYGKIEIDGRKNRLKSPRHAIRQGFGFCPENRHEEGLIADLSVRENIILALQARRGIFRRISRNEQQRIAKEFIGALSIATPNSEQPVSQLSGGNQQKAILARWLALEPRFLILDEPTRGIDVGAKGEIEKIMANLCEKGVSILFISSEMEEVVRDSHRVLVLRDRRKVGELTGGQIQLTAIMELIAQQEHNG